MSTLHHHNHRRYKELVTKSSYVTISVAIVIIFVKVIGWVASGSLSILASTLDSLLDLLASLINFFAVKYSLQPPDNEHRFGHEKAEDLAVFLQSLFFGLSGILLAGQAIDRLIYPKMLQNEDIGIYVMLFSISILIGLVIFQRYVMRKTNSKVVEADNFHYLIDLITNAATIVAIYLSKIFDSPYPDPIFALIVSFFVIKGAWSLQKKAFKGLMDHEVEEEKRLKLIKLIKSHEEVKSFHDLKTRYAGNKYFVQFHLEMDPLIPLMRVHTIIDSLEKKIKKLFRNAEVIIHADPYGIDEEVQYKD